MDSYEYLGLAASHDALRESAWVASNPTPLTGIASTAAPTSLDDEVGLINCFNEADPTTEAGIWVVPVYIRLRATQANTSGTSYHLIGRLDDSNRHSSGGSELTNVNVSLSAHADYSEKTAKAEWNFGALTLTAESSDVRTVFNVQMSDVIFAADDQIVLQFGGSNYHDGGGNIIVASVPRVRVGPGANLSIHEVSPSSTDDPAFEVEIHWVEVGHGSLL